MKLHFTGIFSLSELTYYDLHDRNTCHKNICIHAEEIEKKSLKSVLRINKINTSLNVRAISIHTKFFLLVQ